MKCGCLAQLEENIARVTVDLEKRQILDIRLYERNLRFKCKRCAIFCCKLGGPGLAKKDIERIKSAGYDMSEFTEPAKRQHGNFSIMQSAVKSKEDGSCIFLTMEGKTNAYKCLIYDFRPTLCKLYPFSFKKRSHNSFILRFIPCCSGLNVPDEELVNEKFIANHLSELFFEIFEQTQEKHSIKE